MAFPPKTLAAIAKSKILGIRAGATHRVIGVWVVVVERRVFIRSWTVRPDGWFHAFREDPNGILEIDGKRIKVRAVQTRSERLKDAVEAAYAGKYTTPGARQYVKGFRTKKRRDTLTWGFMLCSTGGKSQPGWFHPTASDCIRRAAWGTSARYSIRINSRACPESQR